MKKKLTALLLAILIAFNPITVKDSKAFVQIVACPGASLGASISIASLTALISAAAGIIVMIMAAKDSKQEINEGQLDSHQKAAAGYSSASNQWMSLGITGTIVFGLSAACIAICDGVQPYCYVGAGLGAIYMGVGFGLHVHYKDLKEQEEKKVKELTDKAGSLNFKDNQNPTEGDLGSNVSAITTSKDPYASQLTEKLTPPELRGAIPKFANYQKHDKPIQKYAQDTVKNLQDIYGPKLNPTPEAKSMFDNPSFDNAKKELANLNNYLDANKDKMNNAQFGMLRKALDESNELLSGSSGKISFNNKNKKSSNPFDSSEIQSGESGDSVILNSSAAKEALLNTNAFDQRDRSLFEQVSNRYSNVYNEMVNGVSRTRERPSERLGINNPFGNALKESFSNK